MSFLDYLLLWLHIGFAIFALGPATVAAHFTPRYIRAKDVGVLRFLNRTTRIFGLLTVAVFLFGLALGRAALAKPYLSVSMTLFIVGAVLLVMIERDQRTAIRVLSSASPEDDAQVQTGRIAMLASIMALLWLIILVLMVWFNPNS